MNPALLPPGSRVTQVALTVSDLEGTTAFYREVLGLDEVGSDGDALELGAGGESIVRLVQDGSARVARGTARLYHFAILYPSRRDLARALLRLTESRWPVEGASDHLVSEAIYLSDPERNGIELYRDRSRAEWPWSGGQVQMATLPLDVQRLLGDAQGRSAESAPPGTTLGHIHLHVHDIAAAEHFYREVLGLELMLRYGDSASFLAAGGYHHHVAVNVWGMAGARPAESGALGLRWFRVQVPDSVALNGLEQRLTRADWSFEKEHRALRFRDPAGHTLIVETR